MIEWNEDNTLGKFRDEGNMANERRTIKVEGRSYTWTTAGNLQPVGLTQLRNWQANGSFHGVIVWDEDGKQYKAPLDELTMASDGSFTFPVLPRHVAAWILAHIEPAS